MREKAFVLFDGLLANRLNVIDYLFDYLNGEEEENVKVNVIDFMFDEILELFSSEELGNFLKIIYNFDFTRNMVVNKSKDIMVEIIVSGKLNSEAMQNTLCTYLVILKKCCKNIYEVLEIIEPFITKICKTIQLNVLNFNLSNYSDSDKDILKSYIDCCFNKNKNEFIYNMVLATLVSRSECGTYNYCKDIDEVYVDFFERLVVGLMKNENVNYSDIELLNRGYFCDVYKIGEKVLKIGINKVNTTIPNSKYIIQPLIRFDLKNKDMENFLYVEVNELADQKCLITEDDVYELYCKLRSEGIKWLDPKVDNIGRLIKKNSNFLNNEEILINQETNGFLSNNSEILGSGELVLIDIDLLYLDTDVIKEVYDFSFENRWNSEQKSSFK